MNEIYALHYKGQLITPDIWKGYSENYGKQQLYGWRPPKKVYYKKHHAKNAIGHLPPQIQKDVEIIRYVPAGIVP